MHNLAVRLCRPVVFGEVPMTRFRHTGVVVNPEPSSTIGQLVNQRLHPSQHDASQGSVILLFGGYNTMGQEFGGDQFEVHPPCKVKILYCSAVMAARPHIFSSC